MKRLNAKDLKMGDKGCPDMSLSSMVFKQTK